VPSRHINAPVAVTVFDNVNDACYDRGRFDKVILSKTP
jgi:hypothetical protein